MARLAVMVEEERKYEVDTRFTMPDLVAALPPGGRVVERPPVTLTATYFDTSDLRLARAGASLRFRRGDEEPWTVKLPADSPGVRHEISRLGQPGTPPADLVGLVTALSRGAPLAPAAVVRTVRRAHEIRDGDDNVLAELADDTVSVLDGRRIASRFREVEVERKAGSRKLLDQVEAVLRPAGAVAGGFTPKHVRALGEAATREPDLVPPRPLGRKPTAGEVVTEAIRLDIARILSHDPLVRLRAPVGKDDTAVHQMRVGARRLRSDLRTFGPLVDSGWSRGLRDELAWIAAALGAARDAEVLRARLRRTVAADPLAPLDEVSVARIDADLAARHEDALVELDAALAADRYAKLVDMLIEAARAPRLTSLAGSRASEVLPRLVSRPWRQFAYGAHGVDGAADLDPGAPDDRWHDVRIRGKRARYAVDAVAPVLGGTAAELAKALQAVQDLLGEHQDAAIAADTWLSIAQADPDDHVLAVTAGRLFERERTAIRAVRAQFPDAWRAANRRRLVEWLP
ncbi:MAG TPA: CYTH and CHAD domain-containing protein [Pilimelia sp.]|nr:CYTH and CHAD domain-containing protein [Pilimelia sp.]